MKVCDPCSSYLYLDEYSNKNNVRVNYQSRFRYHKGEVVGYMRQKTQQELEEEKYLDEIFKRHMRNMR